MSSRFKLLISGLSFLATFGAAVAAQEAKGADRVTGEPLRLMLLDVRLNGQDESVEGFIRDSKGHLYVGREVLKSWRIPSTDLPTLTEGGKEYVDLSALKQVRFSIDEESQRATITAPANSFETASEPFAAAEDMPVTRSPMGAFINYEAFAERTGRTNDANAALELGLFGPKGLVLAEAVVHAGPDGFRATRLDSSWTLDDSRDLSSLRLGDSISRGAVGSVPVRFGGVQWTRDFAIQPSYVTLPLPSLSGSAALPSAVDVYVNGALRNSRAVAPGPFQIRDIPVPTGGGQVQAVVRDAIGRDVVTSVNYYTSTDSLKSGLHDFTWEGGLLRRDYAIESNHYGEFFVSTAHRLGVTEVLTVEGQATISQRRQSFGSGVIALVPGLGVATVALAGTQARNARGAMLTASMEHRSLRFGWGVRSEMATRKFGYLGLPSGQSVPRSNFSVFADAAFKFGTVGCNFFLRSNRDRSSEKVFSLFSSINVTRRASLQVYLQHVEVGSRRTSIGLSLTVPLGNRSSVSASSQRGGHSEYSAISAQRDPPPGEGVGYRLSASTGSVDAADAQFLWNGRAVSTQVRVAKVGPSEGIRVGASGGLGLVDGELFLARKLDQSFAVVDLDGRSRVRIYADNHLVGMTNGKGKAVIPGLRAYEANTIAIDASDIPLDVNIAATEQRVRPARRAGVMIHFAAPFSPSALVRLFFHDAPLPEGATIRLDDGTESIVASAGEAFIPLADQVGGVAQWLDNTCRFTVEAATLHSADAVPSLSCRKATDVASR